MCFPIGAVGFLYFLDAARGESLLSVIAHAHTQPLLYIIDTAPFFLGFFARLAGIRQDRLLRFSASLEQQVAEKTESLQCAIEESRRANDTIAHMADHDSLTGLLNRRRFQRELDRWGQYALRYKRSATLVFVDLDRFKVINDSYGHHVGDEYLKAVADILTKVLRTTDTVARWGGDEFAILLPETTKQAACEVATKLIRLFAENSLIISGHELRPSASIGLSLFPDHGSDFGALVVYADAAMYEAKAAGRNCWRLYSASPQELQRVQEHKLQEGYSGS